MSAALVLKLDEQNTLASGVGLRLYSSCNVRHDAIALQRAAQLASKDLGSVRRPASAGTADHRPPGLKQRDRQCPFTRPRSWSKASRGVASSARASLSFRPSLLSHQNAQRVLQRCWQPLVPSAALRYRHLDDLSGVELGQPDCHNQIAQDQPRSRRTMWVSVAPRWKPWSQASNGRGSLPALGEGRESTIPSLMLLNLHQITHVDRSTKS